MKNYIKNIKYFYNLHIIWFYKFMVLEEWIYENFTIIWKWFFFIGLNIIIIPFIIMTLLLLPIMPIIFKGE